MDTISIFCAIDDFCELFEPRWQQHLLAGAPKQRDRKPRLCLSEVLTIHRRFSSVRLPHLQRLLHPACAPPPVTLLSEAGQLSALCGIDARCAPPAVCAADGPLWALQRDQFH